MEELQQQLAAALLSQELTEAKFAVAEAAREKEAAGRLEAEAAREKEAAGRIAAEAALAAEAKRGFFDRMLSISCSNAADSTNDSDAVRRGAPAASEVPLEELLADIQVEGQSVVADTAWAAFLQSHLRDWTVPRGKLKENLHMHPTIKHLLSSLLPREFQLWCNVLTEDEESTAHIQPDFTVTHARDSLPSLFGAALLVEVKLPGNLVQACNQACCYMRRRIYKLCCESDARGEVLHDITVYGVATDGKQVVILCMDTGAPLPGGSYSTSVPCPVRKSPPLHLLDWDYKARLDIDSIAGKAPAALPALLQLLASPRLLGRAEPLRSLIVQLTPCALGASSRGGGGDAVSPASVVTLELSRRLGCGGTSDAYACSSEGISTVLKVARCATQALVVSFTREITALQVLGNTPEAVGAVPSLLSHGHRMHPKSKDANRWPVLLLQPCGQPLAPWMSEQCDSVNAETRRELRETRACQVARQVLVALRAAHKCSLIHCDVRPSNIVVSEGKAVLIDWGHSRPLGDEAIGSGVVAYSDGRIHTQTTYRARRETDLLALIYTWLSMAWSSACEAPWLSMHGLRGDDDLLAARSVWLQAHEADNNRVGKMVRAHDDLLRVPRSSVDDESMHKIVAKALE
jgi:hypothetical protein